MDHDQLAERYRSTRQQSEHLCAPLAIEDFGVQPMEDASPPKWHLAHTTWFFETFVLKVVEPDYVPYDEQYEYLFNSYYNGVGQPFPRAQRGFLSRPTVSEVLAYRKHVDEQIAALFSAAAAELDYLNVIEIGINHEQQHQELLVTDLKYNFGNNPLAPRYVAEGSQPRSASLTDSAFVDFAGGITSVGVAAASADFKFDNECPCHEVLIHPFQLADRLVSNGEFLEFVRDGGYQTSSLWLSEGWQIVKEQNWQHPLYWQEQDGQWYEYRLDGRQALDLNLPLVHISGHESFAFAAWKGARLPTEFEWEFAAGSCGMAKPSDGAWLESGRFHPAPCGETTTTETGLKQMFGTAWQWTQSSYAPYPGFKPLDGTLGEYNGKFMSSQWVLRGGSCVTPYGHVRASYRNFFYPPDRWQFSGLRLAADA